MHVSKQDRQYACNVTLMYVRATIVAVEKQYYILWVSEWVCECVCGVGVCGVCVCVCVCVCVNNYYFPLKRQRALSKLHIMVQKLFFPNK
jgi:hypothetical protein